MNNAILKKLSLLFLFSCSCLITNAQIKYWSDGNLTVGTTTPYKFYNTTIGGTGVYLSLGSKFLQMDITPQNPRIAGSGNKIVFYNTQTRAYNDIEIRNMYQQSDARAKTNIQPITNGMSLIKNINPVSYNFIQDAAVKSGGSNLEFGLIAQELETLLPNLIATDQDGKKLINYTGLIPVLINAIQTLQSEVESLEQGRSIK